MPADRIADPQTEALARCSEILLRAAARRRKRLAAQRKAKQQDETERSENEKTAF